MPRRVYWDSCTFLGLLNQEPMKVNACRSVWNEAENGKTLIYRAVGTERELNMAFNQEIADEAFGRFIDGDIECEAAEKIRGLFDLLLEVYMHGENSDLHARIKAALPAGPWLE